MIIGKAISPFALRKKNGGSVPTDADAQAFITATGISGTNATATNQLVIDLKSANIWTKMKAVYPMVGGTSTTCKFNLKDPRDINAAYRLVFNGGATFSANGIQFNGTNSYADTFFNPSAITNNNHLSYYSRTNVAEDKVDIGAVTIAGVAFSINPRAAASIAYFQNHISATYVQVANTDSRGLFLNSRTTSTNQKGYINGILKGTDTGAGTSAISLNVYLGARNNNGTAANYTTKQCAFASIGDGLTDAEALAFYNAVQLFNTTLARQV